MPDQQSQNKKMAEEVAAEQTANQREKYWEELSIEEKIEKMHQVVFNLLEQMTEIRQSKERLLSIVESHVHDEKGKALIKKEIRSEFYRIEGGGIAALSPNRAGGKYF